MKINNINKYVIIYEIYIDKKNFLYFRINNL